VDATCWLLLTQLILLVILFRSRTVVREIVPLQWKDALRLAGALMICVLRHCRAMGELTLDRRRETREMLSYEADVVEEWD
jgi:hypothetical protein